MAPDAFGWLRVIFFPAITPSPPPLSALCVERSHAQVIDILRMVDRNGDGLISKEELRTALAGSGKRPRTERQGLSLFAPAHSPALSRWSATLMALAISRELALQACPSATSTQPSPRPTPTARACSTCASSSGCCASRARCARAAYNASAAASAATSATAAASAAASAATSAAASAATSAAASTAASAATSAAAAAAVAAAAAAAFFAAAAAFFAAASAAPRVPVSPRRAERAL